MVTFFACLALLIIGFFTYGKIVESVFRPDARLTPCTAHPDGVDYVPMKPWRAFLIQLLNIAGLGPIFGALSGAIWGPVVYLWIVLGLSLIHIFILYSNCKLPNRLSLIKKTFINFFTLIKFSK